MEEKRVSRKVELESISLSCHMKHFAFDIVRLTKVLKNEGYDIDLARPGTTISIPIPAMKDNNTVYFDPTRNTISFEGDSLNIILGLYEDVVTLLERSFPFRRVAFDRYVSNFYANVETEKKTSDLIKKSMDSSWNKLGFGEIIEGGFTGMKISGNGFTIYVESRPHMEDMFLVRLTYSSQKIEDIKELKVEDIISKIISKIEEVS